MLNKLLKSSFILVLAITLTACTGMRKKTPHKDGGEEILDDYTEIGTDLLLQNKVELAFIMSNPNNKEYDTVAKYGNLDATVGNQVLPAWPENAKDITIKIPGGFGALVPIPQGSDFYFIMGFKKLSIDKTQPIKYRFFINEKSDGVQELEEVAIPFIPSIAFVSDKEKKAVMQMKETDTFSFILAFTLTDGTRLKFTSPTIHLQ